MLEPFTVENKDGEKFLVTCKHDFRYWELTIHTQTNEHVGFLLFAPIDNTDSVKIFDFQIVPKFWRNNIGTQIFYKLFSLFEERGLKSIVGICKSSNRSLSETENLAKWYEKLGFVLTRERKKNVPGYMGKLYKKL